MPDVDLEATTLAGRAKGTIRILKRAAILRWAPAIALLLVVLFSWGVVLGQGMTGVTAWYLLQYVVGPFAAAVLLAVIIYAIRRRHLSTAGFAALVVSLPAVWPAFWPAGMMRIAYPSSIESTVPSATVRLPADVPLKVGWGGNRLETNNHAAVPDQRWAYDLVVAPYLVDSEDLGEFGCYGIPVVAPAAGRVVLVHDGEPDRTPGKRSWSLRDPRGNHVVIELITGTFLVVAHFKPGSVQVQRGQKVEEGQLIGHCGNSGNSTEPHIHIHHQRQNPAQHPAGFAEGLPLYFRNHDGPPMPEGGSEESAGETVATGMVVQHHEPTS